MEGAKLPPTSQAEGLQITAAAAAGGGGDRQHGQPPGSGHHHHAVRKPPAKPWRKPAPLPIPPKVYRVHPRGFRELVQRLTGAGAADHLAPRTEAVVAPVQSPPPAPTWELPLGLISSAGEATEEPAPQLTTCPTNAGYEQHYSQMVFPSSAAAAAEFPSPSLYAACLSWCSSPLLSPGSMACLEQSTVL